MSRLAFPPPPVPLLPVAGGGGGYPVRRIFCAGRNYEAHAAEMGGSADRESPWFFLKSACHLHPSGRPLPFPPGTADLQHEVELVVALGEGGQPWGWAVGLDLTRRDLQAAARAARRPWDSAKDFEGGAVIGPLVRNFTPAAQELRLSVNGTIRQRAPLSDMVHGVGALVAALARLYAPGPGDLLMTGTPAGVGPLRPGDRLEGRCAGLEPVVLTVV